MVIPTPGRPRLDEMPREFFKELAVCTILRKREYPQSKLLPQVGYLKDGVTLGGYGAWGGRPAERRSGSTVKVLEAG
jgi:hypothetical protein